MDGIVGGSGPRVGPARRPWRGGLGLEAASGRACERRPRRAQTVWPRQTVQHARHVSRAPPSWRSAGGGVVVIIAARWPLGRPVGTTKAPVSRTNNVNNTRPLRCRHLPVGQLARPPPTPNRAWPAPSNSPLPGEALAHLDAVLQVYSAGNSPRCL